MIPKKAKPTAKDLHPAAPTDYTYKIFTAIIKNKVEEHLRSNKEIKETQAGFRKRARTEDNLYYITVYYNTVAQLYYNTVV